MRKIIIISMISLDGVMQAPGRPDEDISGGFTYGGWTASYNDEVSGKVLEMQMKPADLLLGRKTFDIFASYWPEHAEYWPGISDVTKYVVSRTIKKTDPIADRWKNSVLLTGTEDIAKLKRSPGSDIKVWGSSDLIQVLFKNDLADELWLGIFPLTLGNGKKLFGNGTIPASFVLKESTVTPSGIIFASYKRSGEVITGIVGS